MDTARLRAYAGWIARMGVNIQQGQQVLILTEPEQTEFLEMLVEECYKAGASKVTLEWRFSPAQRLDIKYQSAETLSRVECWEEQRLKERVELLPASRPRPTTSGPGALISTDQSSVRAPDFVFS